MTAQERIQQLADQLGGIRKQQEPYVLEEDKDYARLQQLLADRAEEKHRGLGLANCQGCSGLGYVRHDVHVDHPEFGKFHICPECRAPNLPRKPVITGVPAMHAHDWLAQLEPHPGRESWEAWMGLVGQQIQDDNPHGMWGVVGNVGSGKTWGGYVLVNEALTANLSARFILASQWLDDLRKTNDFDSFQTREDIMRPIEAADVLIIDQLDWLRKTDFAVEQARLLIDLRYQRRDHCLTVLLVNREDWFWQEQGGSELGVVFSRVGGRWVDTQVDDLRPYYERDTHHAQDTQYQDERF